MNALPASYQPVAPFTVRTAAGDKQYYSCVAAVAAGIDAGASVFDADGVEIWKPRSHLSFVPEGQRSGRAKRSV